MSTTRRELFSMLPAALIPVFLPPAVSVPQETPLPSATYPFDKLPVRTTNNMQIRAVLKGKLATGESLEVHETTRPTATFIPKCGSFAKGLWNSSLAARSTFSGRAPSGSCIRTMSMGSAM
jgi:hypothetical protein